MTNRSRIFLVVACLAVSAQGEAREAGFFQKPGDPTVYRVRGSHVCAVTGQGQLQVLGGNGQVREPSPDVAARLQRDKVGTCPWPDGFYRHGNERTVYMVAGGQACGVVGGGQLEALGGEGRVMTVGAGADLKAGKRDLGSCPWPDGFYRYDNSPQVYRIAGATICAVRSEGQLKHLGGKGRVRTVGAQAHLEALKRDTGPCS